MEENIIKKQEKLRINQVKNLEELKKLKEEYILPIEVAIKKIREKEGLKIFLVDGNKIRNFIDIDFTMGGHGFRYIYVPLNEIWIDSSNEPEKEAVIIHEITEFNLMKKSFNYEDAHEQASREEIKARTKKLILPVGHHRQITPWSCGPSALKIVLDYHKDKRDIKELIKGTGSSPEYPSEGTLHEGFRKILTKLGYEFFEKENAKVEDIEEFIKQGIPVIVDYKAYHGGHFSAVIGYDEKRFLFSDPAIDNKCKWIDKKDFDKRWYEEDEPGVIVYKWLLAIKRK